jgi:serine/threonine protein kinase
MSHARSIVADEPGDQDEELARCALLDQFWCELQREPNMHPRHWLSDRPLEDRIILDDVDVLHRLHKLDRSSSESGGAAAIPVFSSSHSPRGKASGETVTSPYPANPGAGAVYPERIGKYIVVELLGEGAQGKVYRVFHPDLGKECVLKLARRPIELDPAGQARLRDEGRLLARCEHPNLVRVIDFDLNEGRPFLVMEYVHGQTLRRYAEQYRPGPRRIAWLMVKLASAVAFIGTRDIIHQDIKPSNVLVDNEGQPRLIDFGLAGLMHAWSDDASRFGGGTISYMSPEQALGRHELISPLTDVFGLGGVLYYLLTGRPVYQSTSEYGVLWQASKGQQVSPRLANPRVSRALERICMKALEPDPARRYRDAADLERALRRYLARRWIATSGLAVVPLLALASLAPRSASQHPPAADKSSVVLPAPESAPAAAPRIISFGVWHFRGDPVVALGRVGLSPEAMRFEDDVRVLARLDTPAYCYLIALNPDGRIKLCFPSKDTEAPSRSREIGYPPSPSGYFGLTDGLGLQVFVLLASREPLPPFVRWDGLAGLPWKPAEGHEASAGVWRFDGRWIETVSSGPRGEREKQFDSPRPFKELCESLRSAPGIDAIEAVAFSVVKPMKQK